MKLTNKNILLISPESWNHIFVSKHHYAIHLGNKDNQVFFLNPQTNELSCNSTNFKNVFSIQYEGFIKGLRFMPSFIQRYLIRKKFEMLQSLCQVRFDIVWSFDNSVFFDFSALPKSVYCISHIVDLNQDFEFEKAAKTADICFGVCQPILRKLLAFNRHAFFINHGYNHSPENLRLIELQGKNKTKVFYAGNLDIIYIDWSLIEEVINNFPTVDFIFAGPWNNVERKNNLLSKDNLYYAGLLKSYELINYYRSADVLAIFYQNQTFNEQLSNSHKMMEYLGSGKMIVATWTEEYKDLAAANLIKMSQKNAEFILNLKLVCDDLKYWNSDKRVEERTDFAMENTYEKQIDLINGLIEQNINVES